MSYLVNPFASNDFSNLLGGDSASTNITKTPAGKSIAVGGGVSVAVQQFVRPNTAAVRKGVYATYPAATPKYSTTNDDNSLKTQARLLIPFPDSKTFKDYQASFLGYSNDVKRLANTIGVPARKDYTKGAVGYVDFLLTQAQEGFEEKLQVVDVVGDNYVAYFFGQRPPIFSYQGVLMNTKQDDWRLAMLLMYQNVIRGTQLARRNTMVTLAYDKLAVTGALVNMTQILTAEMQMAAQFNFQILVKRIDVERTIGSIPTAVAGLPYAVRPDTFAVQVFGVPLATMRTTGEPTYPTEQRKDKKTDEAASMIDVEPAVHGAPPAQQSQSLGFDQSDQCVE